MVALALAEAVLVPVTLALTVSVTAAVCDAVTAVLRVLVRDVVTDVVPAADADPAAERVALFDAAAGASVPVPVTVADEDCAALRDAAIVGVLVMFAVGVCCAVPVPDTVRVTVAVVDGVAVVVGETVT